MGVGLAFWLEYINGKCVRPEHKWHTDLSNVHIRGAAPREGSLAWRSVWARRRQSRSLCIFAGCVVIASYLWYARWQRFWNRWSVMCVQSPAFAWNTCDRTDQENRSPHLPIA